jgi:hypothetical protein
MHNIKTVPRLAGLGLSQRQIPVSCQIGQATVSDYLHAVCGGADWKVPAGSTCRYLNIG